MKKILLLSLAIFLLFKLGYSQTLDFHSSQNSISAFLDLSTKQHLAIANEHYERRSMDTALVYYNIIINSKIKNADSEHKKIVVEALNKSGVLHYIMFDYNSAYDLFIRALILCEEIGYKEYESKIYTNIGNIYYNYKKNDIAKSFYSKALSLPCDTAITVVLLNNLGVLEMEEGNLDSAYHFINSALQISERNNNVNIHTVLNSAAWIAQKVKRYDAALNYYHLSLNESRKNNKIDTEVLNLSNLAALFCEMHKYDSALHYINLSNHIAKNNNYPGIVAANYLTLSKIEKSKQHYKKSLDYYENYALLRDSLFSAEKFGNINQLQRSYEVTKTNQQIEKLVIEKLIKERTIFYQKIIWYITLSVLLLVSIGLLYIYLQRKSLSRAYKVLVEKNIEIIEFQNNSIEGDFEKYKKRALTDEMQKELLSKILKIMENGPIICDIDFSLDRLAELVQSNHAYVSQVINTALKKNFRSFLNTYRIREAQRLFSEPDITRYTIESIAVKAGFKSSSAFRSTFKEITGVSPNFYLKEMQEQQE
jgi:AraC-like DNA-binding protein